MGQELRAAVTGEEADCGLLVVGRNRSVGEVEERNRCILAVGLGGWAVRNCAIVNVVFGYMIGMVKGLGFGTAGERFRSCC